MPEWRRVSWNKLMGGTDSTQMRGERYLMLRWRSSLWKLVWKELLVYVVVFMIISVVYRFGVGLEGQVQFEQVVRWCAGQYTGVPLTFLLGFYVSLVVKRWWEQYCKLPWPDTMGFLLVGLLPGVGRPRAIRRTVIRYCLVSYVLCLRQMSLLLQQRFPTIQALVESGLIRPDEAARLGPATPAQGKYALRWWLPLHWTTEIIHSAQAEGLINNPPGYVALLSQTASFWSALISVETYGHIPVPLVYTQVVTLAVYVYFLTALIGDQTLIDRSGEAMAHVWFPVFTSLKFLFYFGWLKVAESLYNPFGDDDEDFEMNELVDRHLRVGLHLVDGREDA